MTDLTDLTGLTGVTGVTDLTGLTGVTDLTGVSSVNVSVIFKYTLICEILSLSVLSVILYNCLISLIPLFLFLTLSFSYRTFCFFNSFFINILSSHNFCNLSCRDISSKSITDSFGFSISIPRLYKR